MAQGFPAWGPWTSLLRSLPLTLVCAVASWHGVEKPALTLKRRFARGSAAARVVPA